jgi:hypothetical protein
MSNLGTKLCDQLVLKLMNNLGARLDIAQQKYTSVEQISKKIGYQAIILCWISHLIFGVIS